VLMQATYFVSLMWWSSLLSASFSPPCKVNHNITESRCESVPVSGVVSCIPWQCTTFAARTGLFVQRQHEAPYRLLTITHPLIIMLCLQHTIAHQPRGILRSITYECMNKLGHVCKFWVVSGQSLLTRLPSVAALLLPSS